MAISPIGTIYMIMSLGTCDILLLVRRLGQFLLRSLPFGPIGHKFALLEQMEMEMLVTQTCHQPVVRQNDYVYPLRNGGISALLKLLLTI